mmetsp:Transcript_57460/g.130193  ORF Transcript_57460/g.130193 Transcript_57460/m.130193 type:complete len:159 (+) Transcript_57460:371-847(+)|eukprot:CAMPEP_0172599598 /NCGR_PEP_ID=MMETSP1068-20121228/19688_1 /TAXON_ID=35684 /ORGANISM="Pseudopedinella elastica, Strain CCMP716" /LENGTH=158 /DNA_ID=CAMNT_0013399893 /DNA_START=261 /DNA_END=737 /DNA_ORIENTATION=-
MAEEVEPLPEGWSEHHKNGKTYYYNKATKKSTWKRPVAFVNDGSFMERVKAMQQAKAVPKEVSSDNKESDDATTAPKEMRPTTKDSTGNSKRKAQEAEEVNSEQSKGGDSDGRAPKASRFTKSAAGSSDAASEYLRQVQELQSMDKQTDSTGGKWLVR